MWSVSSLEFHSFTDAETRSSKYLSDSKVRSVGVDCPIVCLGYPYKESAPNDPSFRGTLKLGTMPPKSSMDSTVLGFAFGSIFGGFGRLGGMDSGRSRGLEQLVRVVLSPGFQSKIVASLVLNPKP